MLPMCTRTRTTCQQPHPQRRVTFPSLATISCQLPHRQGQGRLSHWTWNPRIQLAWPTNEPLGCCCLCLRSEITGTYHHVQLFNTGAELKSSCSARKALYQLNHLPSPIFKVPLDPQSLCLLSSGKTMVPSQASSIQNHLYAFINERLCACTYECMCAFNLYMMTVLPVLASSCLLAYCNCKDLLEW